MRMKRAGRNVVTLMTVLLLVLIAACAPTPKEITPTPGEVTPPSILEPTPEAERGIIEIRVTDPGLVGVNSANVTARNIEVHEVAAEEGEWIIIIPGPVTFDLVKLAEEEEVEILGEEEITTGSFTQIRMDVDVVEGLTADNMSYTASVPSEKLKIVRPFNVEDGVKTILTLDFDGDKSLVMTGEGKFIFKPVVKLLIEKEKVED